MVLLSSSIVRALLNSPVCRPSSRWICSPSRRPLLSSAIICDSNRLVPSAKVCWAVMRCGAMTCSISVASVTGAAPCLSSALHPALEGLVILPGTTNTVLPCAKAWAAVLSVPLRALASVIKNGVAQAADNPVAFMHVALPADLCACWVFADKRSLIGQYVNSQVAVGTRRNGVKPARQHCNGYSPCL